MCYRGTRVVIERIGGKEEFRTLHLNVIVEYRHLTLGIVFAPIRGELSVAVDHLSTFEEIRIVIEAVEVEAISIKCGLTMFQYHIVSRSGHLFVTIVISIVADQREGVALQHLYVSESFKRVASFIEIGTVAVQSCALMGEMNLTIQNRSIWILVLVEVKHVSMYQIDAGVLHLCLTWLALL